MIKTLTKVGNSQGIIFDAALMNMAHLKPGDEVNVEVHTGGTITLTPTRPYLSGTSNQGREGHNEGIRADDEEARMSASPDDCFHLTVEIVEEIHAEAIARFGGSAGIRDIALLESAVAAPQSSFGRKSPFADIPEVAAAYL